MSDNFEKRERDRRVVVVTGFGPFSNHTTNASWEAVKELKNSDIERNLKTSLVVKEIPVAYDSVLDEVPRLWEEHKPTLVVHVGVSSTAKCLTLESKAHVSGYSKVDVNGQPAPEIDRGKGGTEMRTGIDVEKIRDEINRCKSTSEHGCNAVVSDNAGRFLCEYIFSRSLLIQTRNTMFVHVPDLDVYSADKTAKGLYDAVRLALEELEEIKENYLQNEI